MARTFNGSSQYISGNVALGLNGASAFTMSLYVKPAGLSGSAASILSTGNGTSDYLAIDWENIANNQVGFRAAGYSGTNPATGSGITLDATDVSDGCWIAYRYDGTTWTKWKNGTATTINASITFALPTMASGVFLACFNDGSELFAGTLAELSIWRIALTDAELTEHHAGVAADQVAAGALAGYWPLRGNSTPEPSYIGGIPLTVTNGPTAATHPTIVPPRYTDTATAAWVIDLAHPDGTIRGATMDLSDPLDADILGAAYPMRVGADVRLIDALPDGGAGVMVPATVVATWANGDDTFTATGEYRQVPATIRYYDRTTHALMPGMTGVVIDAEVSGQRAVTTISSMDAADLEVLIPRITIEPASASTGIVDDVDGIEVRHDVGAPIPVVMGRAAYCLPPYLGSSGTAQAGQNMVVGFGSVVVERAWTDTDPRTPGLELMTLWSDAPGTPTYVNGTTFTVNAAYVPIYYAAGIPVRRIASGGTTFSDIAGTATGGTIYLTHSILGSPLGTVQIAGEYAVERNRFSYVGAGGTTALTTLRLFTSTNAPVIARVTDTTFDNPAGCVLGILGNTDWGVGGSVNVASFVTAAAAFDAAGLGTAVSGVLGGEGAQRRALDVVNEFCSFRGARVWKDGDGAWNMTVDTEPTDPVVTLSYGPDAGGTASPNNVRAVVSITTTPLTDATSVLKLQYGKSWRDRGDRSIEQVDYFYRNTATALSIGRERIDQSPWISNNHQAAARVTYYRAKRTAAEDRKVVVEMGNEARRIRLGELVNLDLQVSPSVRLTGVYRVIQIERTLTAFLLTCAGPYSADTYETDSGTINAAVGQPAGDINPDERGTNPGNDANLILNSDWTAGLTKTTWHEFADIDLIPDWYLFNGGQASAIDVTPSPLAKGGATLDITAVANPINPIRLGIADSSTPEPLDGAVPVVASAVYLLSIYASRPDAWRFTVFWFNTSGSYMNLAVNPQLRINPGDVNGYGWARYYAALTAPVGAGFAGIEVRCLGDDAEAIAYRFDAIQFEEVTRNTLRPSPWKRNTRYGIRPTRIVPGDIKARALGKKELGTAFGVLGTAAVALSGGTVTLGTTGVGLITGFTGRITSNVAGVASWNLALSHGGGTITNVMTGLGTAAGTFNTDAGNAVASFPINRRSSVNVVAIAVGGTAFTGGSVILSTHRLSHTPVEA